MPNSALLSDAFSSLRFACSAANADVRRPTEGIDRQ